MGDVLKALAARIKKSPASLLARLEKAIPMMDTLVAYPTPAKASI
jgi:hypothetical protein